MRLRTLPLSLSGVCLGILLAESDYHVKLSAALFTILTTVCLQILSNLCNELGDYLHGTDNSVVRQGPHYSLLEGGLSVKEMKVLIGLVIFLCIAFGLVMIRLSFGTLLSLESICLMMLGAAAISGAMKYTLGRNPYGYQGLGDLFVFIFFGIVAVLGAYFVSAHTIPTWILLLPASGIGFFSVGVLNVNNMRDMKTDAENRVTVAIKLGEKKAKIYHTVLLVLGWASMIAFCLLRFFDPWHYIFILIIPLFIIHLRGIWKFKGKELDPMLPLLVMSTFALSLLMGLGFVKFLLF